MSLFIAIVGTREPEKIGLTYEDFSAFVRGLYEFPFIVVTGGADGIDYWAEKLAWEHHLEYVEFDPDLFPMLPYQGKNNRYFKRNGLIAFTCDVMIAFPSFIDGKVAGGTLNAMNQAKQLGRKVTYLNKRKILKSW